MTIIGLKELSQNAGKIADRVAKGEHFTVVKRSSPVFDISPHKTKPVNDVEKSVKWAEGFIAKHQKAFDELSRK